MLALLPFTALVAAAGLTSAQSSSISSQCKTALTNVLASSDAKCLNPSALLSLVINPSTTSVVGPLTNWATGLCSVAPCSNNTLDAVVANVTAGCGAELADVGISTSLPSSVIDIVHEVYPVIRQVVCLKDNAAGQLCLTQQIDNIQSVIGTITVGDLIPTLSNSSVLSALQSSAANLTCTDCTKASYNIFRQNFASSVGPVTEELQSECGSSFTDGSAPTDIAMTASLSTSTNAAAGTLVLGGLWSEVTLLCLLAVSSTFAMML